MDPHRLYRLPFVAASKISKVLTLANVHKPLEN